MFEYQERLGMIYDVLSFFMKIGMPVIINRLLHIKYPAAFLTLLLSCIIFVSLDMLIHS